MKHNVKTALLDGMFRLYYPAILRIEKFRAVRQWKDGVRQCLDMYKEIGAPRVYLFFDAKHQVWSLMTYEDNKLFKPAFKRLRVMGKMRGRNLPSDVDSMKKSSFYYTPSKWGALGCDDDNRVREQKLKQWVNYYLHFVSPIMKKCLAYRQGYCQRHHRQA